MSAPYCTSKPTLVQQGDKLVAGNGGWWNDGPQASPTDYVYVYQRDGVSLLTDAEFVPPPFIDINMQQPELNVTTWPLDPAFIGHTFAVSVFGVYRSQYKLPDGTYAWDGYEYGRYMSDGKTLAVSDPLVVTDWRTPEPPATTPSFDVATLELVRNNTLAEEAQAKASFTDWGNANPGEYAKVLFYLGAIASGQKADPPVLKTHRGRAIVGLLQASAEVLGRLP